nr:type III secretion system export apparatus subunit SctT [Falsirhodobacter halotolerans]
MTAVTSALTELAYPLLVAASVGVARAMGMILLTPAFMRLGLTGMIRSAVAFAVALPVVPAVFAGLDGTALPSALDLAGLVMKEMAVGAVIGLLFGIPFWAAEMAGELVDLQRGSTMSQLVDPSSAGESSVTATLFTIALITLFFMSGGFLFLLDGFYRSYAFWPADAFLPVTGGAGAQALLGLLDRIMQIAVALIAPVVIVILVVDVMLAFLSRMAPQLHVFDLSMAVKNLIQAGVMVLYLMFLAPLMFDQVMALDGLMDRMGAVFAR